MAAAIFKLLSIDSCYPIFWFFCVSEGKKMIKVVGLFYNGQARNSSLSGRSLLVDRTMDMELYLCKLATFQAYLTR